MQPLPRGLNAGPSPPFGVYRHLLPAPKGERESTLVAQQNCLVRTPPGHGFLCICKISIEYFTTLAKSERSWALPCCYAQQRDELKRPGGGCHYLPPQRSRSPCDLGVLAEFPSKQKKYFSPRLYIFSSRDGRAALAPVHGRPLDRTPLSLTLNPKPSTLGLVIEPFDSKDGRAAGATS